MKPSNNLFSSFDLSGGQLFDFSDFDSSPASAKTPPIPYRPVPYINNRDFFTKLKESLKGKSSVTDIERHSEEFSGTHIHPPTIPYSRLSAAEIDKASNIFTKVILISSMAGLSVGVNNLILFKYAAGAIDGAKAKQTLGFWQIMRLGLGLKLASSASSNIAKLAVLELAAKENWTENQTGAALTIASLIAKAGFDIRSIMKKAAEMLDDPTKITAKRVTSAYFGALPIMLACSAVGNRLLADQKLTLTERSISIGVFTALTMPPVSWAVRESYSSFNKKNIFEAYIAALESFSRTETSKNEMGFLTAVKKLVKEGHLTDEIKPPLRVGIRAMFGGTTPAVLLAIINTVALSPEFRAELKEQVEKGVIAADEFISAYLKPKQEEEVIDAIGSGLTNLVLASAAISARTAGSGKAAGLALNNPQLSKIGVDLGARMFGAIVATTGAIGLGNKMKEANRYSETEVNVAVTVFDQLVKMVSDVHSQKNNIEQKAKIDPKVIKVTIGKIIKANFVANPLFTLRSFLLWRAANKENPSVWQNAAEAGASSVVIHPGIAFAMKVGWTNHQTVEDLEKSSAEKIWQSYKKSAKEMGWTDVYNAYKDKTFVEFKKELIKSIKISYGGALRTGIAAAVAGAILAPQTQRLVLEILSGSSEDTKPEAKDVKKPAAVQATQSISSVKQK